VVLLYLFAQVFNKAADFTDSHRLFFNFITPSIYNLSQRCGSGFRARRGAAQKRSIHVGMWAFWADSQHGHGLL